MTVIAISSRIDAIIAKMLTNLMHSNFSIVVAMFQAIRSQDGQRQAVRAAAAKALASDDYRLMEAVWKVSKPSRERRNEFAHYL
jgi:hypothetical protein